MRRGPVVAIRYFEWLTLQTDPEPSSEKPAARAIGRRYYSFKGRPHALIAVQHKAGQEVLGRSQSLLPFFTSARMTL